MDYRSKERIRKHYRVQVKYLSLRTFNMLKGEVSNNICSLSQYIGRDQESLMTDSFRTIFKPKVNEQEKKEKLWDNVCIQNISKIMNLDVKFLKKKGIFLNSDVFNKNTHGPEIQKFCKSFIIQVLKDTISTLGPEAKSFSDEICNIVSVKEISM